MLKGIKYGSAFISIVCYTGSFLLARNSELPDWEIVQELQSLGVQILLYLGIMTTIISVIGFLFDHIIGDDRDYI